MIVNRETEFSKKAIVLLSNGGVYPLYGAPHTDRQGRPQWTVEIHELSSPALSADACDELADDLRELAGYLRRKGNPIDAETGIIEASRLYQKKEEVSYA